MSTEIGLSGFFTEVPNLQGTLVAFVTPSGFPSDIPIMEGERTFLGRTANSLQYTVQAELPDAIDFYRREMEAQGWVGGPTSQVLDKVATLEYQLGERKVNVIITEDLFFGVIVSIIVEG